MYFPPYSNVTADATAQNDDRFALADAAFVADVCRDVPALTEAQTVPPIPEAGAFNICARGEAAQSEPLVHMYSSVLVSVIMPVFNGARTLREAAHSILNQTLQVGPPL